jgi:hypothetical protein
MNLDSEDEEVNVGCGSGAGHRTTLGEDLLLKLFPSISRGNP